MKKNILIKIGERYESRNVEMTPEEEAEFERQQAALPEPEPTLEERLSMMEDAFAELYMEVFKNGEFWANHIKQGKATIDDVPKRWREEVKSLLS